MKLQGASTPRPMTHDLMCDMLGELDARCTQVAVTELRENTFFATITLSMNGRELEIDSRPSDALALAVRSGAPIFAAEDVIAESAIEFEHEVEDQDEVVEKFKDFLDRVSPEDFLGGEPERLSRGARRPRARERELEHARDELLERDPGRVGGLREQRGLGEAGDRVDLEELELVGLRSQIRSTRAKPAQPSSS